MVWPIARLRRRVVRLAGVDPGSRVLDVATGTGAQALAFAAEAGEVVGVDISEAMLRIARRRNRFGNLNFREADATELPFQDGSFDVSCIAFALHEMPVSVRSAALHDMARVTRPTGTIIVVDYALPRNAFARAIVYRLVRLYERDHYADFVRSDLHALLHGAGIGVRDERRALLGGARILVAGRNAAGTEVS